MAGHGVGVAWARVPGRGGGHLEGGTVALAYLSPVPRGAGGVLGVADSLRMGVGGYGLRRLERWLAEAGLQLVQARAHRVQVCRGTGKANELPGKGAGAVYRH